MKVFALILAKEFLQQVSANTEEEEAILLAEVDLPTSHRDFDRTTYKIMDVVDPDTTDYGKGA